MRNRILLILCCCLLATTSSAFKQKPSTGDPFLDDALAENYWISKTCSIGIATTYSRGFIRGVLTAISESLVSVDGMLKEGVQSAGPHNEESEDFDPMLDHAGLWKFSMSEQERLGFFENNKVTTGDDLVVEFKEYTSKALSPNAVRETAIRIQNLARINPTPFENYFAQHPGMEVGQPITGPLWKHFGEYGYIVQAKHVGWCFKTYELVFQIARYSNHFIRLSIQDPELYNYATRVLRAGFPVRIKFTLIDAIGKVFTTAKSPRILWSIQTTNEEY